MASLIQHFICEDITADILPDPILSHACTLHGFLLFLERGTKAFT